MTPINVHKIGDGAAHGAPHQGRQGQPDADVLTSPRGARPGNPDAAVPGTPPSVRQHKQVALLGNPNSGKTTIFNALTGMRQSTANYPGVTVEKKVGGLRQADGSTPVSVLDLPGTYSLLPRSLDEAVVHDVLLGLQQGTPPPDLVVVVLDAGNLSRNLYFASQVLEVGLPTIFVLNMWDVAEEQGVAIDVERLQELVGVPCVRTVGNKGVGIGELRDLIVGQLQQAPSGAPRPRWRLSLPDHVERALDAVEAEVRHVLPEGSGAARGEALRLLTDVSQMSPLFRLPTVQERLQHLVQEARRALEQRGVDWASLEADARYAQIDELSALVARRPTTPRVTVSDRIDQVLTHRVWGFVCFVGIMALVFQSIFSWATAPMGWIEAGVGWLGSAAAALLPDGALESLVVDGMIAGVGNVVVFLPQIFLLFFFIALFEDFGYMARAAFVLDRVMKRVGLNGKAFLPLLSSFACAIPGIMATRTIQDRNDRMATILVAPLMSCSARLPVYALMIGAFIPSTPVFGMFNLQGVTLLSMYVFSLLAGLGMAALFRRTLLKGNKTPFIFELPPYRIPNLRTVALAMWERGREFLYRAGSIIFCISIVLWFLASYPRDASIEQRYEAQRQEASVSLQGEALDARLSQLDKQQAGDELRYSFAGRAGHLIEPVIKPLGFDWKIGVGLIASFAAREVLVSTLAIVYNVGEEADESSVDLVRALRDERDPLSGAPRYTPLTAIALMVFFVLACQCMSTVAIVRRETNSWGWPLFMIAYMTTLAWLGAFLVYQCGRLLGFG